MNDEAARQGRPDNNTITDAQDTAEHGLRIPRVTLIVELEADPQLVMDCATAEDRLALIAWISECQPATDQFLRSVAREIRAKKKAA